MNDIAAFVSSYRDADRGRIHFAWNGKHSKEFFDSNQAYRWEVAHFCIATPQEAPLLLLEHLFLADAAWAREAWGSPPHFAQLGAALLMRGQESALDSFGEGFTCSFDTFGACHEILLPQALLHRLTAAARQSVAAEIDGDRRKRLEAIVELFSRLEKGTADQGWAKVEPGAKVMNIRVVRPRWYHRVWVKITDMLRRRAA